MFTETSDSALGIDIVSIIIPTHNRWRWLREAIASVLSQSYRNFEVIVVDDGSTDDTDAKLAGFRSDVRVLRQEQKGVSAARNHGVSVARGRYLAFLDSDDLWLPEKLKVQTEFMDEHPEAEICQTDEIWIRGGIRVNPKRKHEKPSGDIFRRSLELCLVSPSAVMMTHALFNAVGGFDESLPVCEDYDLWLRIAARYSVPLIPQALTVKRGGHEDQLSRSVWGMDRYRVTALQKLLRTDLAGEKRRWAIETLRRKLFILSQGARKRGKEEEVLTYEKILSEFVEEPADVRGADPRLCGSKRLSLSDGGTVVGVE